MVESAYIELKHAEIPHVLFQFVFDRIVYISYVTLLCNSDMQLGLEFNYN